MNHQVYVRLDDTLWVGAKWLGTQRPLTRDDEYLTLEVPSRSEVCFVVSDGRRLCDFGAEHDHDG